MLKKNVNIGAMLLLAVLFFITGYMCITNLVGLLKVIAAVFSYGFFIAGILSFFIALFTVHPKKKKVSACIDALVLAVIGAVAFFQAHNLIVLLPTIISLWALVSALIRFINSYICFRDGLKGFFRFGLEGCVFSVFALAVLIKPWIPTLYLFRFIGIYFIVYGFFCLLDAHRVLFPNGVAHSYRIPLPVIFSLLIPQHVEKTIAQSLKDEKQASQLLEQAACDVMPDMEIFIHLGTKGFDSVGHVDIAFDNIVLSYGCHDHHTTKMMGALGDGIIYFAEKGSYLNMAVNEQKKSLVSFGIRLSTEEKRKVKRTILALSERFTPWLTDQDLADQGLSYLGDLTNYASKLTRLVHPKFYKFINGKFKTYFVLTTNCVQLADTLVMKSGLDLLKISGINTPGSYYDFLNMEYSLRNNRVLSRHIYTALHSSDRMIHANIKEAIDAITDPQAFITSYIFSDVEG